MIGSSMTANHSRSMSHNIITFSRIAASTEAAAAAAIDESRRELTTPADIIENATKTLETIQKTVTDATDEIHKTIEENLTDLKTLEKDMQLNAGAMAGEMEDTVAPLQKKASSKTLGGKSDIVKNDGTHSDKMMNDSETTKAEINSAIETTVNVIDSMGDVTTLNTQDSDERISERAISMGPDMELMDGPNVHKIEDASQNSNGGPMRLDPNTGAKDHV